RRDDHQPREQRERASDELIGPPQLGAQLRAERRALLAVEQPGVRPLAHLRLYADPLFVGSVVLPHSSRPTRRDMTTSDTTTARPEATKYISSSVSLCVL